MAVRPPLLIFWFALGLAAAETPSIDPLFQAIQRADAGRVKQLLDRGVSPDSREADGTPALLAAALYADADCVRVLLDKGANPNITNAAGATALMWAIPDLAKVQLLVAHGADVNARSTNLQRTPLLIAASYPGTVDILKLLVDKGADIHAKDRGKVHALGRAMLTADVAVVRFLVERGCDPNEPGYAGGGRRFARHDLATIEYLTSHGAAVDRDALANAATWHDPMLIEKWIAMGADVNARSGPYGRTALMTAAASEQATPATLQMLLDQGADPNAEDSEGERPLDWARYRNDQARIDVLEQHGATAGKGPRQLAYPAPDSQTRLDPAASLTRSVALLLSAAPSIFLKRGCVSCHSQALPAELAAVAQRKGIPVSVELAAKNRSQILAFSQPSAEAAMQGDELAGNSTTLGYIMAAFAAEQHPLDKITAAYAHLAAAMQMPDGRWLGNGVSRPPEEGGIITTTAMAVRAMVSYPLAGHKVEWDEKLRRAQAWLLAAPARTAEERGMRLMGLVWTKAPQTQVQPAIGEIISQQRADGGWQQSGQLAADAYATGISLYALHEAGINVKDDMYRKGVAFLLANQYADGSWLVKTHSYPVQPYFESGYPFGRNQWISSAGASWASLAIAFTLPDAKP